MQQNSVKTQVSSFPFSSDQLLLLVQFRILQLMQFAAALKSRNYALSVMHPAELSTQISIWHFGPPSKSDFVFFWFASSQTQTSFGLISFILYYLH